MARLLEAVASWQTLAMVLVMFGFAPGFCLRLIVLAYPRGDPRRAELVAELYAVPRIQRPLWVTEQLEVALFEGIPHRVSATLRRLGRRRRGRVQSEQHGVGLAGLALVVGLMGVLWIGLGDGLGDMLRAGLGAVLGAVAGLVLVLVLGAWLIAWLAAVAGLGLVLGIWLGVWLAGVLRTRLGDVLLDKLLNRNRRSGPQDSPRE